MLFNNKKFILMKNNLYNMKYIVLFNFGTDNEIPMHDCGGITEVFSSFKEAREEAIERMDDSFYKTYKVFVEYTN